MHVIHFKSTISQVEEFPMLSITLVVVLVLVTVLGVFCY